MATEGHEFSRWREVENPIDHNDPLGDLSFLKPGHLPTGFIILTWNGTYLSSPMSFQTQEEADAHLDASRDLKMPVTHYLIIPKP